MKSLFNITTFLFSIALLVVLGLFLFYGTKFLLDQYDHLDPQWSSGIIIIATCILLSTIILSRAIYYVSKNQDKSLHPEKAILYANFIELWSRQDFWTSKDKDQEIDIRINAKQMILWADDRVLQAFYKLQKLTTEQADQTKIRSQIERVILAMRKDVGHRNIGILVGDISGILQQGSSD